MLLTVTRNGFLRKLSFDLLAQNLCRPCTRRVALRCSSNVVGYLTVQSIKNLNKKGGSISRASTVKYSSESTTYSTEQELTAVQFEKISDETLDSLTEYFDELVELAAHLPDADVSYGDGVLTVKFGDPHGTYVINRQTPNKQIWLSSPKSGPKRYDFMNGKWIYKHDGKTLHELLNEEIPAIIRNQACFDKCSFSGREKHAATNS